VQLGSVPYLFTRRSSPSLVRATAAERRAKVRPRAKERSQKRPRISSPLSPLVQQRLKDAALRFWGRRLQCFDRDRLRCAPDQPGAFQPSQAVVGVLFSLCAHQSRYRLIAVQYQDALPGLDLLEVSTQAVLDF